MMRSFTCNVCGAINTPHRMPGHVPGPLCATCGSSTRFRKVAYALSRYVLGGDGTLFRLKDPGQQGIGLSDAHPFARAMACVRGYTNTYFHREPRLDIMQSDSGYADLDYLISSDVFEHTPPPRHVPFRNAYAMLKPGGALILSVPACDRCVEHFPRLHRYHIEEENGHSILVNYTAAGDREIFRNLRFHGGPGATLEMRIFSVAAVEDELAAAGFTRWRRVEDECVEFGIENIRGLSTIWIAIR